MAKFNIEVELDWMDEEAYSIDDELRERIVKGVENALLEKATNEAVKAVDNKIAEKILEAEETIQATVDQFIANVCEEKIGKIVIPEKKNTWSDEVTYKPLSEYVGERFELFLTEKRYDRDGRIASYSSDRKLSAAGLLTGGKSGDQTGREICIRSYYNKPWIHVYRYTGVTASASGTVNVRNYLQKGDSGDAVKEMQKMLIGCGFSCGSSGVDGSFGGDTEKALLAFQAFYGLEQDGKYGPVSKSKLVSAYNGKTAASVPEKKNTPSYTAGHEYALQVELKVRTGPGTNYSAKKHSQLTADGQKHDKDNDGCLDAGTVVTCQEVRNVGNDIWMKAPSGWMAAYYDGKVYIK